MYLVWELQGQTSELSRTRLRSETPRSGLRGLHPKNILNRSFELGIDIVHYRKRMNITKCYRSLMLCETVD